MKIYKGTDGLNATFQEPFPETTKCSCGGIGRIALVAREEGPEKLFVYKLHRNEYDAGKFWPHDALYNQA